MSKQQEALRLALEALENSIDLVSNEAREAEELYGKYPTRLARIQGLVALEVAHEKAITAVREALAEQPAQQQEPVAKKKHEPKIDLGKYAGTYGGYTTPEPSEGYLQKAYRLANELRSHLSIAPAQRTWVGLTDDEVIDIAGSFDYRYDVARAAEAKLKEKNT